MKRDTTINITDTYRELIVKTAKKLNISKNELMIRLIKKYMNKNSGNLERFCSIQYQTKSESEKLVKEHLWIDNIFYEKCQDVRRFHKLSVSFVLALAIKLYIDTITTKTTDIYRDYFFSYSTIINNSPIYITAWTAPDKKTAQKLQQLYSNT